MKQITETERLILINQYKLMIMLDSENDEARLSLHNLLYNFGDANEIDENYKVPKPIDKTLYDKITFVFERFRNLCYNRHVIDCDYNVEFPMSHSFDDKYDDIQNIIQYIYSKPSPYGYNDMLFTADKQVDFLAVYKRFKLTPYPESIADINYIMGYKFI